MKVLSLSCMALAIAEEAPSNRTLLNARRLADGRRLTVVKCEIEVYPNAYGKGTSGAYSASTNTHACDQSGLPAVVVTGATSGLGSVADDGTEAAVKAACCKAEVLCSVSYADHGGSTTNKIAACPTTGNKVPADLKCYTTDGATSAKCGSATADHSSDLDKTHCCRQMCNDATGGFETGAASTTLQDCPANAGTFQVSSTAYCAGAACATSTDDAVCCQKKCTNGFVLHGVTKVTVSPSFNDQNCALGADRVHPTAYCAGKTCASSDASTCCQNKCSDGYVKFTASPPTGKRACATGLRVSPDAYCSGPTCATADDATCCETKCDKSGSGFELNGQTTTGMQQCAKDLAVHPTEYCDGTSCAASAAVCCQQKCTAGFKVNGATGSGIACKKDDTIHTTAHCKGSTCADTDEATCCNQMCTHKTNGFKVNKGPGTQTKQCADKETVNSKEFCKGDCSADDASKCCQKNNATASVSSAKSSGLASLVAGLLVIAAAAK